MEIRVSYLFICNRAASLFPDSSPATNPGNMIATQIPKTVTTTPANATIAAHTETRVGTGVCLANQPPTTDQPTATAIQRYLLTFDKCFFDFIDVFIDVVNKFIDIDHARFRASDINLPFLSCDTAA